MALMNLGLGGFSPVRNDSQVVASDDNLRGGWDSWLSNWNNTYQQRSTPIAASYTPGRDEAIQSFVSQYDPGQGVASLAQQAFGAAPGNDGLSGYVAAAANMLGGMDAFNRIDNMGAGSYSAGYTPDPAELQRMQAEKTQMEDRRNAMYANQQAYDQQTGNGFAGGILNDSYSQPFSNTVTGAPSAQQGFGTGLMGGAGTTAAPSTGLTPFGAPAAPQGQQTANAGGWGGPFSNKNPWSLG